MRIAVVHSFYGRSKPSGENTVVEAQVSALLQAGHVVRMFSVETDELRNPLYGFRTAFNVMSSSGEDPSRSIQEFGADVVHIHNLHPNFGTRWIRDLSIPTVLSLHNYRAFCSNGLLYRDGNICAECPKSGDVVAIKHACYRESRLATIPLALSRPSFRKNVIEAVDEVITTSELSDAVVKDLAVDSLRTSMIPNFGSAELENFDVPKRVDGWLALGRFSAEKGFVELLDEWPRGQKLTIVGSGPLEASIRSRASELGVSVLPPVELDEMRSRLAGSLGLVFPSRWYEADPQVVVESMALGVPVVPFHVNSAARVVDLTGAGSSYGSELSLRQALEKVEATRPQMSALAREAFEGRWTKRAWLRSIEALYERLVLRARSGS